MGPQRITGEDRGKRKKPSSEYMLPMMTSQQHLKTGNETPPEGIQQKPMAVKGDPVPMQSEHSWKTMGDMLYHHGA